VSDDLKRLMDEWETEKTLQEMHEQSQFLAPATVTPTQLMAILGVETRRFLTPVKGYTQLLLLLLSKEDFTEDVMAKYQRHLEQIYVNTRRTEAIVQWAREVAQAHMDDPCWNESGQK
jgi:signal transduction histidine kinase